MINWRMANWWKDELLLPRADVILLVHSAATAMVDTFTFPSLQVFVANMVSHYHVFCLEEEEEGVVYI